MLKKVLGLVILLAIVIGGWALYKRHQAQNAIADGDVSGLPSDSKSSVSGSDQASPDNSGTVYAKKADPPPAATAAPVATNVSSSTSSSGDGGSYTLPSDSPNGMAFAGKGEYQWYRQGNLTYRLNTKTGSSCIAYATMEEWRKPIVMEHGCGRSS
jgi:hypothetical protein